MELMSNLHTGLKLGTVERMLAGFDDIRNGDSKEKRAHTGTPASGTGCG